MNGPDFKGSPRRQSAGSTPVDVVPVGIAFFAPDRRLQLFNRHFPDLTGLSHDRLAIGMPFAELMSVLRQRPDTMAFQQKRNNGRLIDVRTEALATGGCLTIVTDITRIHDTEDALRLSRFAADAAEAAKARFLRSVSTGLRTPLMTILAEAASLACQQNNAHDAAQVGKTIEASARSLLGLVDAILDLTRLETGPFNLADDTIDLPQLVRSVLRRFDPLAAAAEITVVVDLPLGLPAVRADATRLRQAVSAVIANALAVTGPFDSVSIRARHDWASGGLLLQVQDTGSGMTEHELESAFDPLSQLDKPNELGRGGAGLSLYTARILMRAHGGDLILRSTPGQGTVATLNIPVGRVMQVWGPGTN